MKKYNEGKMKLEYCDICDEPTGNAGIMDDSLQCLGCGKITCSNCGEVAFENEDGNFDWLCVNCIKIVNKMSEVPLINPIPYEDFKRAFEIAEEAQKEI